VVARTVFPERFLPDRGLLPKLLLQERLQALDVVADGEFVTVVVELLAVALTVGTMQVALTTTEKGRVPVKFPRGTWNLKRSQLELKAEVERRKAKAKAAERLKAKSKSSGWRRG